MKRRLARLVIIAALVISGVVATHGGGAAQAKSPPGLGLGLGPGPHTFGDTWG